MNLFGIMFIVFGSIYLMYSILFRHKTTIYFRKYKIIENKEKDYLRLQLRFSIINSLWLLFTGFILISCYPKSYTSTASMLSLFAILVFHFINSILISISKKKRYIALK